MKRKSVQIGSLAVTLSLLLTSFVPLTAAAAAPDTSAALQRMQSLAIIPASDKSTQVVSRGMFVETVIASEGLRAASKSARGTTIFPDVPAGGVLSGYVNAGLSLGTQQGVNEGVVYGNASGKFGANTPVTFAEACTTAVRLLGYTDSDTALSSSSWPSNYITEAAALGLTTGLSAARFSNLTVAEEAVIFNNLFNSVMKSSGSSGTGVSGSGSSGSTFFSDNYYDDSSASGTLTEITVLGNSKSSDNLASNQILTATGTLTLGAGVTNPVLGAKYKLYVSGTTVTKLTAPENALTSYTVTAVNADGSISAKNAAGSVQTLALPAITYYYHGSAVDSATAAGDLYASSTVLLAGDTNGDGGYAYGVIVDPYSGDKVVSGTLQEAVILGNTQTSDNLSPNQILTSLGTLTLASGVAAPELGGKYKLYVSGTTVTKVGFKENATVGYAVKSVNSGTGEFTYDDAADSGTGTMSLPQANTYYYHGAVVDYASAENAIQNYSSLILGQSAGSSGYDYCVIVDPNFGQPYVYNTSNTDLMAKLSNINYDFVYRNGSTIDTYQLVYDDVLYFVSDIWGKNAFIYDYEDSVTGVVSAVTGSVLNPTAISITTTSGRTSTTTSYSFNPYCNRSRLIASNSNSSNFIGINSYITVALGMDGKIIAIQ